jgi:hypothetical protein
MSPTPNRPIHVPALPTTGGTNCEERIAYPPLVIPPLIRQAQSAFFRDLARWLQERPGQWVAYHGDQPIGFARTKTALYQQCLQRGLTAEEFVVLCIEPEAAEVLLLPREMG